MGKGWALLQATAYWEWCEAAGERPASNQAIARMLLPSLRESPEVSKGFDPAGESRRLRPFFRPLRGGYRPARSRKSSKAESRDGVHEPTELLSFGRLRPLLRQWRARFERGMRVPDGLRGLTPGSLSWMRVLLHLGASRDTSFESEFIESLPQPVTRARLLLDFEGLPNAPAWNGSLARVALDRIAPSWASALDHAGLMDNFLRAADAPGLGPRPTLGSLLMLLADFLDDLPAHDRKRLRTSAAEEGAPDFSARYWLCPEVLEARRISLDLDCDEIEQALVKRAAELALLPPEHPRRRVYAALALRRRAVVGLGMGGYDLHYWLWLGRGEARLVPGKDLGSRWGEVEATVSPDCRGDLGRGSSS